MPSVKTRSIGLKKIIVGDVVAGGGMPLEANMVQLGRTFKGTANFTTEQGTVNDFYCEEEPNVPVESVTSEFGLKNLTFNILEWDNDTLKRIFGGKTKEVTAIVDGESRTITKYVAPGDAVEIEQAVRAITPFKKGIDIPRAKIIARFVWNFSRTEIAQIEVVARVMAPLAATDGPYELYDIPAPDPEV
jgi:hypothetical protein